LDYFPLDSLLPHADRLKLNAVGLTANVAVKNMITAKKKPPNKFLEVFFRTLVASLRQGFF
tara:strand:+ start:6420 stop:6602 length:183 start_codon:yes stop_codon:yes gene_type:complete